MSRAAVLIGVDQSGKLDHLNDAVKGAKRMHEWALAQGMPDETHAKLITDEAKPVTPDRIYSAINQIVDGAGVEQLIVYFAGHGINVNRSEHWLLSDAPVQTWAAVNVSGSVELARYCGIQHVVIISDACRVAPEGIQAQNVRGVDIFPNDDAGVGSRPVDQFFACLLGGTSAEIKDPRVAAGTYQALYTTAVLDALHGRVREVLEPSDTPNWMYVRPRKLELYLEGDIPRRVSQLKLTHKVNQNPDAIITSDVSWLSRVPDPGLQLAPPPDLPPAPQNLQGMAQNLVRLAARGSGLNFLDRLEETKSSLVSGAEQLVGTTELLTLPFGPDHFESQCGIKVRGPRILDFFAPRTQASVGGGRDVVRVDSVDGAAASVLLRFEGDIGAVIPAIPGFIAALTFDGGALVDVAYEPSANSHRWNEYAARAHDVRSLRAIAASSSQHGRFRLDQDDAGDIARQMQYSKAIDPTLAVYAAYAYHDLQATDRIREMAGYMRSDLGATFFDLELLGRTLIGKQVTPDYGVVPFFPLLAQGWALLGAHRIKLPAVLEGIERTMKDSLWSLFDQEGLDKLRAAMASGEVR